MWRNRVTVDCGADINELSCKKLGHPCQVDVVIMLKFRNLDSRSPYDYVIGVANPFDFCGSWHIS